MSELHTTSYRDSCHRSFSSQLRIRASSTRSSIPKPDVTSLLIADEPLQRYGDAHEVYVLLITADDAALEERLMTRGRESREEVSKRVARAKLMEPKGEYIQSRMEALTGK